MLKSYIVSYDLRKVRNYEALYTELKSFPIWGRIQESTWLVKSTGTPLDVFNRLRKNIDSDDRLFVIQSGYHSTWCNVICDDQFLKNNL